MANLNVPVFCCVRVACCLLLCALSCSCLPCHRRSASDETDAAYCEGQQYQPTLPIYQLNHGIEAAYLFAKYGALGALDFGQYPSSDLTFYTTLLSLTQVAVRLERSVSLMNASASLEMRALSAIVGQITTDACNFAVTWTEDEQQVDCSDLEQVANFSFSRYDSLRAQEPADYLPDPVTVAEAYTLLQLLPGVERTSNIAAKGKNAWVQALIPENLHAPICNDNVTHLDCCSI